MFWERFAALCKQSNTSPNTVCKELGKSNATATHWKNGSIPKGDILSEIAQYFNVSVDYLLGRTDEPRQPSLDEQLEGVEFALYGEVKDLTEEQKQDILDFVRFKKAQNQLKKSGK